MVVRGAVVGQIIEYLIGLARGWPAFAARYSKFYHCWVKSLNLGKNILSGIFFFTTSSDFWHVFNVLKIVFCLLDYSILSGLILSDPINFKAISK